MAAKDEPRHSTTSSLVWRASYRVVRVVEPLIRSWIANRLPGLDGIVELRYTGRRTGRARRALVTLLEQDGRWYVGHPNGCAGWLASIIDAGFVDVEPPGAHGPRFTVRLLPAGPERDAVIRATLTQQPFPANLWYRAFHRHVAAAGVYVRLDPPD